MSKKDNPPNAVAITHVIEAFESGKFRQIRGPWDNMFAFYPAYCAIALVNRVQHGWRKYWFVIGDAGMHGAVDSFLGLDYICLDLYRWNDTQKLTFPQIGAKLREYCKERGIELPAPVEARK